MRANRIGFCIVAVVMGMGVIRGWGADRQPATAPAVTRRAAKSNSPREQLPFTNSSLTEINPKLPTLFIVGDSTAARNNDADHRGWCALLVDFFDTRKVNLVNQAKAGASFPSYFTALWPAVIAAVKPGDFVVIELGHNGGQLAGTGEETASGPARRNGDTPPITLHTYGWYVRECIHQVRAKGGTPIISSTTTRNIWSNPKATFQDGTLKSRLDGYDSSQDRVERGMGEVMENGERSMLVWAREVAAAEKAPYVDHSDITADAYEKLGREAVQRFFAADHTHTTTDGGELNAETFVAGLKAIVDLPLVEDLNDRGKAVAAYAGAKAAGG